QGQRRADAGGHYLAATLCALQAHLGVLLVPYFGSSKRTSVRTGTSTGVPFTTVGAYFQWRTALSAALSNTPGGVASTTRTSRGSPLKSTVYCRVTEPVTFCCRALAGYSGGGARSRLRPAASVAGSSAGDLGELCACCTAASSFGSAPQRRAC